MKRKMLFVLSLVLVFSMLMASSCCVRCPCPIRTSCENYSGPESNPGCNPTAEKQPERAIA